MRIWSYENYFLLYSRERRDVQQMKCCTDWETLTLVDDETGKKIMETIYVIEQLFANSATKLKLVRKPSLNLRFWIIDSACRHGFGFRRLSAMLDAIHIPPNGVRDSWSYRKRLPNSAHLGNKLCDTAMGRKDPFTKAWASSKLSHWWQLLKLNESFSNLALLLLNLEVKGERDAKTLLTQNSLLNENRMSTIWNGWSWSIRSYIWT